MNIIALDRSLVLPAPFFDPAWAKLGFSQLGKMIVPSEERLKAFGRRVMGSRLFDLALSNAFQSDTVLLFYQNVALGNLGNTAGVQPSSAAGSIYANLHTATLSGTSVQNTSGPTYTPYASVGAARSSGGWTKTGSSPTLAENTAAITFPACTSGSDTVTYFSTGLLSSGAGEILQFAALTASLNISAGITPSFAINALTNGWN